MRDISQVCAPLSLLGWINIHRVVDLMSVGSDTAAVKELTVQKALAEAWKQQDANSTTHVKATIQEAVELARSLEGNTQVLVTGSLHLVGGLLEVIDPDNKL